MEQHVKEAIFGNVGTLLIARTGPEDAKFLESQFEPTFTYNDILNQPNIHWYAKMISGGKYPAPFSLDPGFGPKYPESGFELPVNKEIAKMIKDLSRLRYGRDVNVVQEEINIRSGMNEAAIVDEKPKDTPPALTLR